MKEAIMYLEILLWLRKYQKWIQVFFRWLFWSNNSNSFLLHKHKGGRGYNSQSHLKRKHENLKKHCKMCPPLLQQAYLFSFWKAFHYPLQSFHQVNRAILHQQIAAMGKKLIRKILLRKDYFMQKGHKAAKKYKEKDNK